MWSWQAGEVEAEAREKELAGVSYVCRFRGGLVDMIYVISKGEIDDSRRHYTFKETEMEEEYLINNKSRG